MFDPSLMAEALEAGATILEAVAYANSSMDEWLTFAADNPTFLTDHQSKTDAIPAAAKVHIARHIKSSPSFDEALRYLGIVQPATYGPKANIHLSTDKPFILLPTSLPIPSPEPPILSEHESPAGDLRPPEVQPLPSVATGG